MANTTYVLYGPGKDSSEVLGNFPTGLKKTADKANFPCPICIPVNSEYGALEDSHNKMEINPHEDDRILVCAIIPKDSVSDWTTYCHILADHLSKTNRRKADFKMCADDKNIYAFLYQDDLSNTYSKKLLDYIYEYYSHLRFYLENTQSSDNWKQESENNESICNLLKDYINHLYTYTLEKEGTDFRHKGVIWTILFPDKSVYNDEKFMSSINAFKTLNKYKYAQYSSPNTRLLGILNQCLPHDEISEENYLNIEMMISSNNQRINEWLPDNSDSWFIAPEAKHGYIWFCSQTENNPYGYTEEESKIMTKHFQNRWKKSMFPFVISTYMNTKIPGNPMFACACGVTITNIEGAFADDNNGDCCDGLPFELWKYINREDIDL